MKERKSFKEYFQESILGETNIVKRMLGKIFYKYYYDIMDRIDLDIQQIYYCNDEINEKVTEIYKRSEILDENLHLIQQQNVKMSDAIGLLEYENSHDRLRNLEENIRDNNEIIKGHEQKIIELEHESFYDRVSNLEENIRNNNEIIKKYGQKIIELENSNEKFFCELAKNKNQFIQRNLEVVDKNFENKVQKDKYYEIDYFDFENHFRGPRDLVKNRQKQYIQYYERKKNVLDFGCGRGEFLELLQENGIGAVGIDTYGEFVEYCKLKELNAICGNGLDFLRNVKTLDGIFLGQVVEHLAIEHIIELCELAYEKLIDGSFLIIETPNPKVLGIYANAFYMDPSHVKPVHPLTMQYLLEKAGFKKIKILYTPESRLPVKIPELSGEHINNVSEFNQAMQEIAEILFGSQDYAIIAQR